MTTSHGCLLLYVTPVQCIVAVCMDDDLRIIGGDGDDFYEGLTQFDSSFYINDELAAGRLEICDSGVWKAICVNVWDFTEASVACGQLGFSRAGESKSSVQYTLLNALCIDCRRYHWSQS